MSGKSFRGQGSGSRRQSWEPCTGWLGPERDLLPQINMNAFSWALMDTTEQRHTSHLTCNFPAEVEQSRVLFCISVAAPVYFSVCSVCSFCSLLVPGFAQYWGFCLNWPPAAVVKCWLVVLSSRRVCCTSQRTDMHLTSFVQA